MSRPVAKREALEEAALALFARQGVEGTTTRQIAEAAGCAEGTMFRHWASKEDLAWDLYDTRLRRFMAGLEAAVGASSGARNRLRAMVECCFRLFEEEPVLCSFLLLAEHHAARRMKAGYRTPVEVLIDVIREGQRSREIRSGDPGLFAALAFGAVLRVPVFRMNRRIQGDLRRKVDPVTDAVFEMMGRNR
jgi:AcrR family transcriptional regulator